MLENAASKMRLYIGSGLVLLGAAAAVYSPFRPWYDGRLGRHYGVDDLFDGITDSRASIMASVFLPMLVAAVIAVIGVLLRSRLTMVVSALIVLATTVLWMIRQSQISDGLTVTTSGNGLDIGVANALFGGVVMLLGVAIMGNQRKAAAAKHRRGAPAPEPVGERIGDEPLPDNVVQLPDGVRRVDPAGGGAPDWQQTADGSPDWPQDRRDAA